MLPEKLAAHAHITENAAFVGLGATFQIWEPERYGIHEAALLEQTRRSGATMPSLGHLAGRRRP